MDEINLRICEKGNNTTWNDQLLGFEDICKCEKRINNWRNSQPHVCRCAEVHGYHNLHQSAVVGTIAGKLESNFASY